MVLGSEGAAEGVVEKQIQLLGRLVDKPILYAPTNSSRVR